MTTYPCPFCGTAANLANGCPGCRRPPDPDAAEVIRLDAEIPVLANRLAAARAAAGAAHEALYAAQSRRAAAAARVHAALAAALTPTPEPTRVPAPVPGAAAVARGGPEASTRTVQNVLFLLGGLLLGTAAIVFTAVAWASYGVGVRAALLATFTGLALAAPLLAVRRGLTATAETFAALGLLLLLLDGYAAWYVDLFGVSAGSAVRYAGVVCAVTAAVAVGYGARTGLLGPRFAALLVVQPVLPLVSPPVRGFTGWAVLLLAAAAVNLAVLWWRRAAGGPVDRALRAVTWAFYAATLAAAAGAALIAALSATRVGAVAAGGAALVAAALLLVAAAPLARTTVVPAVAGGALVLAVALAAALLIDVIGGAAAPVSTAAVVALLAVAVLGAGRLLPREVHVGPWAAALAVLTVAGLAAFAAVIRSAADAVAAARPVFAADLGAQVTGPGGWQVPVTVALLTAAAAVLLPRGARAPAVLGGAVLGLLALPAALAVPWWVAAGLDLAGVAGLAALALRSGRSATVLLRAVAAVVLLGHAVGTGLGRLSTTAAVLAAVLLIGVATAALAYRRAGGGRTPDARRMFGGMALTVGLLAWPGALAAGLAAVRVEPWWVARGTVAAVVVLVPVLAAVTRRWAGYRGYAFAAVLTGAVPIPVWGVLASGAEPTGVYAAVALLCIAAAGTLTAGGSAGVRWLAGPVPGVWGVAVGAAVLPALWLAMAVVPDLWAVLGAPYGWLDSHWSGRPSGTGLAPTPVPEPSAVDAVAVGLLALAVYLPVAGRRSGLRWVVPVVVPAVVLAVAAARAPWPVVPAVSLLTSLALLVLAAWAPAHRSATAPTLDHPLPAGMPVDGPPPAGGPVDGPLRAGVPVDGPFPAGVPVDGPFPAGVPAGRAVPPGAPAGRAVPVTVPVDGPVVAAVVVGGAFAGAGLAGALPTPPATLAALGIVVAVASAIGAGGRSSVARSLGWLSAVTASVGFAIAAGSAAGLAAHLAAFGVLAVAVGAMLLSALLGRRPPEAGAVQAAAHATAVSALLLALPAPGHAAVLCTIWGVVLGLHALRATTGTQRRSLVVAAAVAELLGWWLLMVAGQVALLEAYTVPAAGVAVLAGWLALRGRPWLGSWLAYGPALAAGFLPSLASVLVAEQQPVRRLVLGAAAVAVVLAGAARRLQAPVVVAGGVLAAVALHELALIWDLLPRWIPLAVGGLLLVALAMTLERRRRDLARVRAAVTRMS